MELGDRAQLGKSGDADESNEVRVAGRQSGWVTGKPGVDSDTNVL